MENSGYKSSLKNTDISGLVGSVFRSLTGSQLGGANPLRRSESTKTYEKINRDAGQYNCPGTTNINGVLTCYFVVKALQVCEAYASAPYAGAGKRLFAFISAEDIFRPIIPARYIETKREAEQGIAEIIRFREDVRAAYIRPSE